MRFSFVFQTVAEKMLINCLEVVDDILFFWDPSFLVE